MRSDRDIQRTPRRPVAGTDANTPVQADDKRQAPEEGARFNVPVSYAPRSEFGAPQGDRPRYDRPRDDRPQGDRPRFDGPRDDRPRFDRPYGDRPQGDRPRFDRPREDRPQGDRPRFDGPRDDRPRFDRPYGDRPQGDRPRFDRPREDRPQGDRPRFDGPRDDRPRFERPYGDRPQGDRPRFDRPREDRPQGDRPRFDGPRDDRPRFNRPYGDRPQGDRPRFDRPREDRPQGDRPRFEGQRDERPFRQDQHRDTRTYEAPRSGPAAPQVRPPASEDGHRLSKVLGERGLASRREADDWIAAGWVLVNGQMAVLGQRVQPSDKIEVDPAAHQQQAKRVTILINKPIGYVSGQAEDGYEPASVLVTQDKHWQDDTSRKPFHPGHARGLAPAGRLDIDSTGLLVLTQDGRIAKHLIGEDSDVEKEYLVRVEYQREGTLPESDLNLLNHGLELDGHKLKPAKVSWANEDQLRFVLREGRKRQIRRMCELVGLKVVGLKRVRIGSVVLGKLPMGEWRYLREDERF
ncbi:pseudouridine synthase [Ideonella margarita]|uniref:Dual-specificity RNA pseudouridine synthase RluF n=1 Tax=Ideonella margarita TaxID=2984191 RepID=A0ABU9CA68_9BURK